MTTSQEVEAQDVTPQPVEDSQVIDTNDFDIFSQLDDLTLEDKDTGIKQGKEEFVDVDFDSINDIKQDENGHDIEAEDAEEEGDDEENSDNLEEITEEDLDSYKEFASSFEHLPDDLEISINGKAITKGEIASMANESEQFKTQKDSMEHYAKQIQQIDDYVANQLHMAQTETSKQLQAINKKLNNPSIPEIEKGALYSQLQALQNRQADLNKSTSEYSALSQQRREAVESARIDRVSHQLEKKYSAEEIKGVVDYVHQSGVDLDSAVRNLSPEMFEIQRKAKAYDELMAKSKDKIKTAKPTRSVAAKRKANVSKPSKNKAIKALEEGNVSSTDLFNALVD